MKTLYGSILILWRGGSRWRNGQISIPVFDACIRCLNVVRFIYASLWCFMSFLTIMAGPAWALASGWLVVHVLQFQILHRFVPQNGFLRPRGCLFSMCWQIPLLLCVGSARLHSTPLCCIRELFYWIFKDGGEEIHKRDRLFSVFEQDFSNFAKDSCIILISVCSCVLLAVIIGVSILFWLLGCVSFSIVLQFSAVLQGFRFLVRMCLQYEYLLFGVKKILCLWFLGRLCDPLQCRHVAGCVFYGVHCSVNMWFATFHASCSVYAVPLGVEVRLASLALW
jgi:hypothetical protein